MRFIVIRVKYIIFAVLALVLISGVFLTSGRAVMTFLSGGREIPIYSVERPDDKIALTFDCAWNDDDIDEIIATLEKYNCTATFFVTGTWAEDYSNSLNKLYRSGFEIGIHSYNHDDYTKMSSQEIENDMEKCDTAVMRATGYKPVIARAPSGAYNDNVVKTIEESGRACIQWSVDGLDYVEDATTDGICEKVISKTTDGDIILLHNGTEFTADALPEIIEKLRVNHELVNVSDLIYKSNYTIDHTGRQKSGGMV